MPLIIFVVTFWFSIGLIMFNIIILARSVAGMMGLKTARSDLTKADAFAALVLTLMGPLAVIMVAMIFYDVFFAKKN